LSIPAENGEPLICNISYRISDGSWMELEDWEDGISREENDISVTFPVELDWGSRSTIYTKVSDNMGSNSIIACPVILSRPPSVEIVVPMMENEVRSPGEYTFEASVSDPDGQVVECTWSVDDIPITCGRTFTTYLSEGPHSVGVEVTDGQWTIVKDTDLTIERAGPQKKNSTIDVILILSLSFLVIIVISLIVFSLYALITAYRSIKEDRIDSKVTVESERGSGWSECDICLKALKNDRSTTECRCGAVFHRGCGKREGVCPECGREILL
jgi:hypothetical protein